MAIEVEYLSKDFIKPTFPTPKNLRKLHFSFIDQHQTPVFMSFMYFYEKSNKMSNVKMLNLLKQSLPKALHMFYPLAGRINNDGYADCNDEGALFVEAKANCKLSYLLQNRTQFHGYSEKFLPWQHDKSMLQYGSVFQITCFNCGGLAVSFAMQHVLGDATSELIFLRSWAAITRGETARLSTPQFGLASLFPPQKKPKVDMSQLVIKEKLVTKFFVFDALTLSHLREKYSSNGEKLSRVLALSVFILSRIRATVPQDGSDSKFMVFTAVNMRPFIDPPISQQSFGNLQWPGVALIEVGKEDEIPKRIKDSVASVNAESVKRVQSEGDMYFLNETFIDSIKGKVDKYSFSSLCHLPLYETDFGWGKPEWIGTDLVYDNFTMFADTKEGRGIEAWISMAEEDMAKFEIDKELISHVSSTVNASPNSNSRL